MEAAEVDEEEEEEAREEKTLLLLLLLLPTSLFLLARLVNVTIFVNLILFICILDKSEFIVDQMYYLMKIGERERQTRKVSSRVVCNFEVQTD